MLHPIHFTANFALQVTLSADGMVLRLYLEKVKRWMSEGRKAEAAALMQEMFKRPELLVAGNINTHLDYNSFDQSITHLV